METPAETPSPRTALITGVTGLDGGLLAAHLASLGYAVVGTTRATTDARAARAGVPAGCTLRVLDLQSRRDVAEAVAAVRPREIYHLAGQSSVGKSFADPAGTFEGICLGTLNLLEAVRGVDPTIRCFVAGSGEVFGDTGGIAATESTPFAPQNPYATAKAAATWLVRNYREAYGLYACTGILFNHESPRRPIHFVTRKIVAAAVRIASGSMERLRLGNLDVARDWGWADEYVEALPAMLQQDAPEDFVIATGRTCALREFAAAAFAEVGLDWADHVEFDPTLARPTDVAVVRADPSRAAARLGWRARTAGPEVARRMVRAELDTARGGHSASDARTEME
jgi:GDPmannose 4,6-dehydratase